MVVLLSQITMFSIVSLAVYSLLTRPAGNDVRLQRRVELLAENSESDDGRGSHGAGQERGTERSRKSSIFSTVGKQLLPDDQGERSKAQSRLIKAGIYSPTALTVYFASRLVLFVLPPVVGMTLGVTGLLAMSTAVFWGAIAGGFGLLLPSLLLDHLVVRFHRVLRKSLPDFLDLTVVCLESGMSLQSAIQRVSDELRIVHPVLAGELGMVQREIELGATVQTALRRFADRSALDAVRTLSTFVQQAQRYGTTMADAFRMHGDMLRTQREQRAEEMAQKAAVKILMPTMLLIFPAVFVVLAGPAAIQIQENFNKSDKQSACATGDDVSHPVALAPTAGTYSRERLPAAIARRTIVSRGVEQHASDGKLGTRSADARRSLASCCFLMRS